MDFWTWLQSCPVKYEDGVAKKGLELKVPE
jgi:hypothetical protein